MPEVSTPIPAAKAQGETKAPKTTLFLRKFGVPVKLVDNFICGGLEDGQFKTAVMLTVDRLDDRGFVIETDEFINRVRRSFAGETRKASCEELAHGVAQVAVFEIGIRLVSVDVRVFNMTGFVDFHWERGQEAPTFPRRATRTELNRTEDDRRRPDYSPRIC